jgi:hypothetical protein
MVTVMELTVLPLSRRPRQSIRCSPECLLNVIVTAGQRDGGRTIHWPDIDHTNSLTAAITQARPPHQCALADPSSISVDGVP